MQAKLKVSLFAPFITLILFPHESFQSTLILGTESNDFCYDDPSCGPDKWPGICQNGKRQSPIDLPSNVFTMLAALRNPQPLQFNRGYKSPSFQTINNGHSVMITFDSNSPTSSGQMTGYGLEQPYIFAQAHFHWGKQLRKGGSEHTINGARYPMELHLVHYSSKYGSMAAAASSGDPLGLSVLGVFIEPRTEIFDTTEAFNTIADTMSPQYQNQSTLVNVPIDLSVFLPPEGSIIYKYSGSLTTPPCSEAVEWFVVAEPMAVRHHKYTKFLSLTDEEGHSIGNNFRPEQALNARTVDVFQRVSNPYHLHY